MIRYNSILDTVENKGYVKVMGGGDLLEDAGLTVNQVILVTDALNGANNNGYAEGWHRCIQKMKEFLDGKVF